jgi:predicted phosphodiesterase
MQHLPNEIYVIYGQHDLPQHSLELSHKSSIDTLVEAGKVKILPECHYGQEPNKGSLLFPVSEKKILVWHHMTYTAPPFPGATGGNAIDILKKYSYDLLVTGDNHQSFSVEYQGRLLVNPGSLTRQTADQIDFQPRVVLWYAETNTIEWVNIPIQKDVITREHIEVKEKHDERISAFISRLNDDWQVELSFEENLKRFFDANQVRESVKQIIYTAIE